MKGGNQSANISICNRRKNDLAPTNSLVTYKNLPSICQGTQVYLVIDNYQPYQLCYGFNPIFVGQIITALARLEFH
jgi:hypothetical protein